MTKALESFPVNWKEARETQAFAKVTADQAKLVVSGKVTPVLLRFFVSGETVHVGELIMPSGGTGPRHTEPDSHKGDAIFYVKKGPLTVLINETQETFHAEDGESIFIPENTSYQCINYASDEITAIFVIAPTL